MVQTIAGTVEMLEGKNKGRIETKVVLDVLGPSFSPYSVGRPIHLGTMSLFSSRFAKWQKSPGLGAVISRCSASSMPMSRSSMEFPRRSLSAWRLDFPGSESPCLKDRRVRVSLGVMFDSRQERMHLSEKISVIHRDCKEHSLHASTLQLQSVGCGCVCMLLWTPTSFMIYFGIFSGSCRRCSKISVVESPQSQWEFIIGMGLGLLFWASFSQSLSGAYTKGKRMVWVFSPQVSRPSIPTIEE